MSDNSKLSSRFKKADNQEIKTPAKLSFSKKELSQEIPTNIQPVSYEDDIKKALLEKIDTIPIWSEYTSEKQLELIKNFVENKLLELNTELSGDEKESLVKNLHSSISGFGPLDYLLEQENVSAVFVNGTHSVHIEIGGRVLNTEMKLSGKQLEFIKNNAIRLSGINASKNILNFRINDLFISFITPEISLSGTNIYIRKFLKPEIDFIFDKKMMTKEIFDFLVSLVAQRKNIVISGDINSGKTTLLDILINTAIQDKRVVLLEDVPQISANSDNITKFNINTKNSEFYPLITNILKTCPDYTLTDLNTPVPEISDCAGIICTLRAPSIDTAIAKLTGAIATCENLSEKSAKTRVLSVVDYIVQINKMKDGTTRVTSIVELAPHRTAALSVKVIAKYVDGQYISEIPQPLTSFRAGTLIAQAGSMTARFQK